MALVLTDKSGNGNTLTNNNGVAEITSNLPFPSCYEAGGFTAASSQYFSAPSSSSILITGSLTLECWVYLTSLPASGDRFHLLSKYKDDTNDRSYDINIFNSAGTYRLSAFLSADGISLGNLATPTTWTPSITTWYHLAMVFDSTVPNVTWYLDGAVQGTSTIDISSIYSSTNAQLRIGARQNTTDFLNGNLTEARFWSVARTQAQINQNMRFQIPPQAGLQAYYPFQNNLAFSAGAGFFNFIA